MPEGALDILEVINRANALKKPQDIFPSRVSERGFRYVKGCCYFYVTSWKQVKDLE